MIKAIIFDCFGVLTDDMWLHFKQTHFSSDPQRAKLASELNRQADLGNISYPDFIIKLAELTGLTPAETRGQIEQNVPNQPLFEYINKVLKPNYQIGMLSNASDNWLDQIFTPDQVATFEQIVLSYKTGFIKPQPEIFALITSQLDVQPVQCVFVDDRAVHCDAAAALGMQAVQYQNLEQFKAELTGLL